MFAGTAQLRRNSHPGPKPGTAHLQPARALPSPRLRWRNRRRVRRRTSGRSHSNYFRDFDPATGRYIESDPIGLDGGINTYAYSRLSPLALSDPFGLVPNPAEITCVDPLQPICWGGVIADVATWALGGAAGAAALATPGDTAAVTDPMQTAKGNVADTQISKDYNEVASAAKLCGKGPPDRCDWLKQNAGKYRRDQVIATQKAWGCRGSRAQK
jgi:RHS repeat-associated protein